MIELISCDMERSPWSNRRGKSQSNPANGKVQDRVDKTVTLTIRNVQQSWDVFSVFDASPLSLIWMSHSCLVLGHKEMQSSESSEILSHIAKHLYCISVTG